jgi:general secretion pathway protein L
MEPERVAVGAFALAGLAGHVGPLTEYGSVAVVDLGSAASDVLFLEHGEAVFARTVSTGTGGLPEAASPLARDIALSVAAHRAQGGLAPEHVYLCGDGAFASGAEPFLSGALNLPVHVMPPPDLDVSALSTSDVADLPRYAKAMAIALSLAGRGSGLNLRRGPLVFERGFGWVREKIPVLAGLLSVIVFGFVFSAWARLHVATAERRALEGALASVTQEVLGTQATSASEAQSLLLKEAALNDEDPMPHADAFDIMVRLSDAVPPSMKHDIEELDVQKGHVLVRGIVGSIPDAQSIQATLAEDRCLSDVKLKSTTQAVGSDRQKYLLELDLKCPEDAKPTTKKKKGEASSTDGALSSPVEGK